MSEGKDIIIQLPTGAQVGVADVETAQRKYPTAKLIGYQDGRAWDGDDAASSSGVSGAPSDKWSRDQLDAYAADLGVEDPGSLPNKGDVLRAIEEASGPGGAQDATDGDTGTQDTDPS